MVLTPFLTSAGAASAERVARQTPVPDEPVPLLEGPRENHVVVAGYGQAARRLVRVLDGSGIPFVITTLSPDGATEAAGAGLPVLLGDASKAHTLTLAGTERAKVLVIADDDPAMAHRVASVARLTNPTMRIIVRTRYIAEMEPLLAIGTDRVISEELESVVQLFADVMRSYDISAEEIERNEESVRRGGYAALRTEERSSRPVVECDLQPDCLARRTVTVRAGTPADGLAVGRLQLTVERLRRGGSEYAAPPADEVIRAGDELTLAGTAEAFAQAAPLFRVGTLDEAAVLEATADRRTVIDTERPVELDPPPDTPCGHLDQIRRVMPSARGCEDCLRIGGRWVHLRICMTCGHVGCCDSSPNRHATAHNRAIGHPIIKSMEPGEDWGWCYPDNIAL
jgi:CPA2 family monovalent cation:H+ antiporter-2